MFRHETRRLAERHEMAGMADVGGELVPVDRTEDSYERRCRKPPTTTES